jgi:hypothetical protein
MMQNGDAVSVQKLFEEPVILSGLLSGTGRIFGDPEPDHAWLHDEGFMRIVYASMPAVYERYKDPDNRAKGEPDLTAKDAIKYLELAAYEAIEVLAEYKKHREGNGDPGAILHELSDMTLTGMFAAACWDDMARVYAEQGE